MRVQVPASELLRALAFVLDAADVLAQAARAEAPRPLLSAAGKL